MYWSKIEKQLSLNNSGVGKQGAQKRNGLQPKEKKQTSNQLISNDGLNTQPNMSHQNISQGGTELMRNAKEDEQIEMGAMDNNSNSQKENQVVNRSMDESCKAFTKENLQTKIHHIVSKYICSGAIFWLYLIFLVIFGIINISVCVSAGDELNKLEDSEAYLYAQETLTQWHKRYIMDIIVTKSDTCPQNYEEAIDYQWPGSLKGCACPFENQNRKETFLIKGQCDSELLSFNCYDLDSTLPQYIRNWRNGQRLCVKRDPIYSFFNSPTSCSSSSTPFRSCGTGQTAICRQAKQECPVSYIQSQDNDNIVGITQKQVFYFKYFDFHFVIHHFISIIFQS